MKQFFIMQFCIFVLTSAYAQSDTIIFIGKVVGINEEPIENVHVLILNNSSGTSTNSDGFFYIICREFPVDLKISRIGFEDEQVTISQNQYNKIEHYFTIKLKRKVYTLKEVKISESKPEPILSNRSRMIILDFKISEDNIFVLLKNRKKCKLRIINIDSLTHFEKFIPIRAKELYKDCLGNIHLFTEDSCYQMNLNLQDSSFSFFKPCSMEKFNSSLGNCAGHIKGNFIFKSFHRHNQQITYWYIENRIRKPFYSVHNKDREIFAQDLLNDRKELIRKYGYINEMGDISVAGLQIMRRIKHLEWSYKFIGSIPAYNPLFVASDTILIFDNIKHEIVFFNNSFSYLNAVQMAYQTKNSKKVYQDHATGKFYLESISGTSNEFCEIAPCTGEILKTIRISKSIYPSKVCFHRDKIYYIDNSFGSIITLNSLEIK